MIFVSILPIATIMLFIYYPWICLYLILKSAHGQYKLGRSSGLSRAYLHIWGQLRAGGENSLCSTRLSHSSNRGAQEPRLFLQERRRYKSRCTALSQTSAYIITANHMAKLRIQGNILCFSKNSCKATRRKSEIKEGVGLAMWPSG